ncbi:MAG: 4Fe-4S binding protein [Candidatus Hydrothermarchaeales archaeon]
MTKLRGGEGIIAQQQKEFVTLRLLISPGYLSSEQLRALADIAEREGNGKIILSSRKGVQVPWIKFELAKDVSAELEMIGLPPGSCGRKVRTIMTCAGTNRCPFVLFNVDELCGKFNQKYYGSMTPTKFKMSLAGCPNSCSNPYINDFGVVGAEIPKLIEEKCIQCGACARYCRGNCIELGKDGLPNIDFDKCIKCGWCIKNCPSGALESDKKGFSVIVGGKSGRVPVLAKKIVDVVSEDELFEVLDKTLEYFKKNAKGRERLVEIINRNGIDHLKKEVLKGVGRES